MNGIYYKQLIFTVKQFALCVFGILLLTQCKTDARKGIEWKTFQSETFLIDYPSDWEVDESGEFDVQAFTCLSPETDKPGETLSVGMVLIIDSTDLKTAAGNFMRQWGVDMSKEKTIKINNREAIYIEANKNDVYFKNYFLKNENTLYYIFLAGKDAAFKRWNDEAVEIVNTFKIINK